MALETSPKLEEDFETLSYDCEEDCSYLECSDYEDNNYSLLFFFLLLLILFNGNDMFGESNETLLFFFLILVILFNKFY